MADASVNAAVMEVADSNIVTRSPVVTSETTKTTETNAAGQVVTTTTTTTTTTSGEGGVVVEGAVVDAAAVAAAEAVAEGETVVTESTNVVTTTSAPIKFEATAVEGLITGASAAAAAQFKSSAAAAGMTAYTTNRSAYVTAGTPVATSSSVMRRTYESSTSPMNAVSRSVYQNGGFTGASSYQTRSLGGSTTFTGAPVMTGQSTYSTSQTYQGQAYGSSYTTSSQIVSQTRGQEALQSERVVSSNVVGETMLGPVPMEEEVKYVEVPVYEEVIKHVPKKEVVVVEKKVPKYEYEWVERIVEIPQIQYVEREVEVPQVHEVVKQVKVPQIIEIPREYIVHKPKYETKIVERIREVPGEIIEVPKPYTVENRVIVPRYSNTEVPVVVAQRLHPRITESLEDFLDVELNEYIPKLVTVDVYVPKPVQRPLVAAGRVDEHRIVDVPIAHFNGLLKVLNINLSEEELRQIFVKETSGAVSVAPIAGPLVSPATDEWQVGHTSGTLHYSANAPSTSGQTTTIVSGYGSSVPAGSSYTTGMGATYSATASGAGGYTSKTTTTTTANQSAANAVAAMAAANKLSEATVASRGFQATNYQGSSGFQTGAGGYQVATSRSVYSNATPAMMGGISGSYTQREYVSGNAGGFGMSAGFGGSISGISGLSGATKMVQHHVRKESKVMQA